MHFHSDTISVMCEVVDLKDNLHVTAYRNDIPWPGIKSTSSSSMKFFGGYHLHLQNITIFNIMLKICTKENICISHTIVEGRRVSDATPISGADTICIDNVIKSCVIRVSLTDVTTAYVLERNGINVSTSTASTTTREPVTSVLAATDQPETVVASATSASESLCV
nr:uncharacterized protein LOC126056830 [Helicoverpa armigera]